MSRHTHELNAPEHAYKSNQPNNKLGGGKGVDWKEMRAVDSDEEESEGDKPRIVDGGYHSELPMGDVWRCLDGRLTVEGVGLVDDLALVYPRDSEDDERGRRLISQNMYIRWVLNLITGAHDNEKKLTVSATNSVPFFGVLVHSQGAHQGVQHLSMPNEKKVKLLGLVLEFCWTAGVDMLSLMGSFVPIDAGAKEAVAMCLRSDSALGLCVGGLVTRHSVIPRREAITRRPWRCLASFTPCGLDYPLHLEMHEADLPRHLPGRQG
jgi:hypothetical protein